MKKLIIIIDDCKSWNTCLIETCQSLGFETFPTMEDMKDDSFRRLSARICRHFSSSQEKIVKEAGEMIISSIQSAIEKQPSLEIEYLIDFELYEGHPEVNGIAFYKKFAINKKAIFISGTTDSGDINKIKNYCEENAQCIFISKNNEDFIEQIKSAIT